MTIGPFEALPVSQRRRVLLRTVLRFVVTFAVVLATYYLLPLEGDPDVVGVVVRLLVSLIVLVAMIVWQVRRIVRSRFPTLRATEALGFALPFFLCAYAASYVVVSASEPASFSEALSHSDALYFAIVVFGTVGFGDIAPVTDPARMLVASQVLLDLVFIALVVRVLFAASRRGTADKQAPAPSG